MSSILGASLISFKLEIEPTRALLAGPVADDRDTGVTLLAGVAFPEAPEMLGLEARGLLVASVDIEARGLAVADGALPEATEPVGEATELRGGTSSPGGGDLADASALVDNGGFAGAID